MLILARIHVLIRCGQSKLLFPWLVRTAWLAWHQGWWLHACDVLPCPQAGAGPINPLPAALPSWLLGCLLLDCAGTGNFSGHPGSKPRWKGVGFGPGKFPGKTKVVTLVVQDQESELHAARSILPVLAGKASLPRVKRNIQVPAARATSVLSSTPPWWQGTVGPQGAHGAGVRSAHTASRTLPKSGSVVVRREVGDSWVAPLNTDQQKARKPNLVLLQTAAGQGTQLGMRDAPHGVFECLSPHAGK